MTATLSLTGQFRLANGWNYKSTDDLDANKVSVDKLTDIYQVDWTDGTGDDQVKRMFRRTGTLLARTSVALDMAGALTDVFGNTLTFATVKAIVVKNLGTVAAQILKFGQLSTPTSGNLMTDVFDGSTTSRVKIRHGGVLAIVAPNTGYTVTGGSADIILLANESAQSVDYDIVVLGTV